MADTTFKSPAATGEDYNEWTSPTNAYSSDGNNAVPGRTSTTDEQDYYNFTFGIPSEVTIDGIEVVIEGQAPTSARDMVILAELSWNGGTNYTASGYSNTWTGGDAETTKTYGGATDKWGRIWADTEFTNGNFRLYLKQTDTNGTNNAIDHIQVKVYYTETLTTSTTTTISTSTTTSTSSTTTSSSTSTTKSTSTTISTSSTTTSSSTSTSTTISTSTSSTTTSSSTTFTTSSS